MRLKIKGQPGKAAPTQSIKSTQIKARPFEVLPETDNFLNKNLLQQDDEVVNATLSPVVGIVLAGVIFAAFSFIVNLG
jgi:hypothetical protein